MKPKLKQFLIIGASTLLLVGCCTTHQVTRWEYKVVPEPTASQGGLAEWQKNYEALLNDLGKDGWIFAGHLSDSTLYFKRPLR
jgi:hypothetical protein